MKKVSVSLFAVLAIVFAVASAFTSNKVKLPASWQAYYMDQDALSTSSLPANSTADQNRVGDVLRTESSAFNVNTVGTCSLDNDHICVAEIKYEADGTTPSAGAIEDFKPGDNPF